MTSRKRIVKDLKTAPSFGRSDGGKGKSLRSEVPDDVNVKALRQSLDLSQKDFALRFGLNVGTLQHWEQGDRRPEGPARVLLTLIAHNPDVIQKAMQAVSERRAVSIGRVAIAADN
jgi:putative transcriptional regulator